MKKLLLAVALIVTACSPLSSKQSYTDEKWRERAKDSCLSMIYPEKNIIADNIVCSDTIEDCWESFFYLIRIRYFAANNDECLLFLESHLELYNDIRSYELLFLKNHNAFVASYCKRFDQ